MALSFTGLRLYQAGAEKATLAHKVATLELSNRILTDAVKEAAEVLKADQVAAAASAIRLNELNKKVTSLDDYSSTLEDRLRECLTGVDVDRLRDLWPTGSDSH